MPNITKRELILLALVDPKYTFRSIDALAKASGLDADGTRALLDTIPGVRRSTGSAEFYTVKDIPESQD